MALPSFGRKRRSALGLDIGSSAVRMAQVAFDGPKPVLEKLGQVALPPGTMLDGQVADPPALTEAINQLRGGLGIRKADVVLGCEQVRGVVRVVSLPWVPEKLRPQSLPLLAADMLPMQAEDAVVDFVEYGQATAEDGSQLMQGLLAAASNEALLTAINAVEAAGLRVNRVDLSALALVRSLSANLDVDRPEAIVDIGLRAALVVVHAGGTAQFVRVLPIAADVDTGRLIDDIRTSVNFLAPAAGTTGVSRLVVTGGSATAELIDSLSDVVSAPVELESAFNNVELGAVNLGPQQLRIMATTSAVCVGLALGEAA